VRGPWLFVRGSESIWLQRSMDDDLRVVLHGPLAHRREFAFHGELELLDFLNDVERRLVASGWSLQRFDQGRDRRVIQRLLDISMTAERRG
jgi:hypothetical protein